MLDCGTGTTGIVNGRLLWYEILFLHNPQLKAYVAESTEAAVFSTELSLPFSICQFDGKVSD
jgi:hypothetical protein